MSHEYIVYSKTVLFIYQTSKYARYFLKVILGISKCYLIEINEYEFK